LGLALIAWLGAGCGHRIPPEIDQARQHLEAGKPDAAALALKKRAFENPTSWDAWNDLGVLEMTRGRTRQALAFLRRAVGADPLQPAPHNNLGLLYLQIGRPDEAMGEFHMAVAADPRYAPAHYNLGVNYRSARLYDRAEASLSAALREDAGHRMARYHRGFVRVLTERYDEALADFKPLLRAMPERAGVHYGYGLALQGKGDAPGALRAFAEAVRLEPDNPEYRLDYGAALLRSGRPDAPVQVERELRKALELAPGFPRAVYLLALFYDDAGRFDAAIPLYRQAVEQGYMAERARLHLAEALFKTGQTAAGRQEARRLMTGTRDPALRRAAGELLERGAGLAPAGKGARP